MKKYKVGDTIYVKGTVGAIDDTALPYCVDFVDDEVWITDDEIADSYNPVKPVLPKDVADELDIAKNELQISFDVYIENVIASVSSARASYYYYIANTNAIIKLADAWCYGWEPLPEKKYYVYVPKTKRQAKYAILQGQVVVYDLSMREICKELTEKQINHFGLDGYERVEVKE